MLELAASRAGWEDPLPPGPAEGIALHESFGSVVAQVAKVSATGSQLQVHRVACPIGCGLVVNPGIVAQQMKGVVVFAFSAAPHGRTDMHKGVQQQKNVSSYQLLGLA